MSHLKNQELGYTANVNNSTLIIGAGYSGLAAAALLTHRGVPVTVLESHSLPGGCASFFQRGSYRYDVGATTLSGLAFNGPLQQFFDELKLTTPLHHQQQGMTIHLEHATLIRYADHELWKGELKNAFPELSQEIDRTWDYLAAVTKEAWSFLPRLPEFPPQTLGQLMSVGLRVAPKASRLAPALMRTVDQVLSTKEREHPAYRKMIDQLLMISAQAPSTQVNALVGALGLMYPADTYYAEGGAASLAQELVRFIRQKGGQVLFRHTVEKIRHQGTSFHVQTQKGEFQCERLISTLPFWNHLELGPVEIQDELLALQKKYPSAWGAMLAYFPVHLKKAPTCLYHQIHTTMTLNQKSYPGSLFASLSAAGDTLRAPTDHYTVTASIHFEDSEHLEKKTESYVELKRQFGEQARATILKALAPYGMEQILKGEVATPLTFEHYTKRKFGRVGGLAHGPWYDLLRYPGTRTRLNHFYRLGDTVFPGQGIVGVISGAQRLVDQLTRTKT